MRDKARDLKFFCRQCPEIGKRCPGPVFEAELYRELHPKSKNLYCIHGNGPSLFNKIKNIKKLPYRKNVSCLVFKGNEFLLVQLKHWPKHFWKFPQGGVNKGETEKEAVIRELKEELGTDKFLIIKKCSDANRYDWDEESIRLASFRWRGQDQRFYLVEFRGKKIRISDELRNCKWVERKNLPQYIDHDHKLFVNYSKIIEKILAKYFDKLNE